MKRRVLTLLLTGILCAGSVATVGCSNVSNSNNGASGSNDGKSLGYQLDKPSAGDQIAIMKTSLGTVKIRLFREKAPKTVENFTTLSKQGYYNGLMFHRVIDGFCVQGGDPLGNGTGGNSIWGNPFEDEFSADLVNLTGAIAMANSGPNTNGSQFFFDQGGKEDFVGWDRLSQAMDKNVVTDKYKSLYNENGGNPTLDGYYNAKKAGHTVFGQVFEGMDVLNSIAKVKVDQNDKPITDVKIESIEITNFEG